MGIGMQHRDRAMLLVHRLQQRIGHRVVAADHHEPSGPLQQVDRPLMDLPDGLIQVEGVGDDVAGVGDLLHCEGGDALRGVVRAQQAGSLANMAGAEASARTVAHA